MADAKDVFLEALMGGSSSGANMQDLGMFQQDIAQNDIYGDIGSGIMGKRFDTSTWTPKETGLTTALQMFAGTLLKDLGERRQADQMNLAASILPQLQSDPLSVARPEGLDPLAFGKLRLNAITRKKLEEQESKKIESKARMQILGDLLSQSPSTAAKVLGIDTATEPTTVVDTSIAPVNPLSRSGESTAEKYAKTVRYLESRGVPRLQAAVQARELMAGEVKANAKSFDEAKEARELGESLLTTASIAKAGIEKAGETGPANDIAKGYEYIARAFGGSEATQQIEGDDLLDSVKPDIIRNAREKGVGAMDKTEMETYLGSGVSKYKIPETNKLLAQKMEIIGKLNLDYADFLEAYREANEGSTVGAQKKWSEYKKAYPLFLGKGENMAFNTARPSWQEFFMGQRGTTQTIQGMVESGTTIGAKKPRIIGFKRID